MIPKIKKPLPSFTFHVQVWMRTESGQLASADQIKSAGYAKNLCLDRCSVVVQKVKCISKFFNLSHGAMAYHVTVRQITGFYYYNNPDGIATAEDMKKEIEEWVMFWPGPGWNNSPKIEVSKLLHVSA